MCIRDRHKEILTADLALAGIMAVVQPLKEIGQNETVITVELKPFGKRCAFAFDILLHGDVFAALRKVMVYEYL